MSEEYDDFEDLEADLETEAVEEVIEKKNPTTTGKVSVFLQSTIGPSQRQEKMDVSLQAPVMDLKYTVGQIFNIPAEEFHLSHAGRTMDPDDIVGNYDVENGDSILLIPVSIAG